MSLKFKALFLIFEYIRERERVYEMFIEKMFEYLTLYYLLKIIHKNVSTLNARFVVILSLLSYRSNFIQSIFVLTL